MPDCIIRYIDSLGRIVIPKAIRKKLHLKEGDPLEVGVSGDTIHLTAHRPRALGSCAQLLLEAFGSVHDTPIAICDRSEVLIQKGYTAVKYPRNLTEGLVSKIFSGDGWVGQSEEEYIKLTDSSECLVRAVFPITVSLNVVGAVLLIHDNKKSFSKAEMDSARVLAATLALQLGGNV